MTLEPPPERATTKRILYFADPMCSWCYGFGPVLGEILRLSAGIVPVRLCVGGLRAGETRPMDKKSKAYVRHHWQEVAAATGQPFDYAFFDRQGFVYDTEPSCRAAVVMRNLAHAAGFAYFAAVQQAFYAGNRDVTREDVLAEIAAAHGAEPADFVAVFRAPEVAEAARADFHLSQSLGIAGFPTVLLQDATHLTALTAGYQPFADLEEPLRRWLTG
jgi:putative protein-disulfide isomerase